MERIVPKKEFAARLGVSEPTLDRREAEAQELVAQAIAENREAPPEARFPRRRQLGLGRRTGRVGFLASEVDEYLRSLPVADLSNRTAAARAARRDAKVAA